VDTPAGAVIVTGIAVDTTVGVRVTIFFGIAKDELGTAFGIAKDELGTAAAGIVPAFTTRALISIDMLSDAPGV